jgi:outer membrane protein TolC
LIRARLSVIALLLVVAGDASAQQHRRRRHETPAPPADETADHSERDAAPPRNAPLAEAPAPHTDVTPRSRFEEHTGPVIDLAEALRMADRRNLSVQTAEREVERTSANITRAWAAFLPHASVQAQYLILNKEREAHLQTGATFIAQPRTNLSGTGTVSQPIVHVDAIFSLRAAREATDATELGIEETKRQVRLGVAQAYYAILSARRFRELQERARENAEEHLRDAEARFDAGVGLRLDVTRAALEVEQAQSDIIQAHATEEDAYDSLGVLIEQPGSFRVIEPSPIPAPSEPIDQLVRRTLERADLRATRIQQSAARDALTASWAAGFVPTLDFAFNVPYTDFLNPLGGGDHFSWNMVFLLTIPIFDGGVRYGNIQENRALLREAELRESSLADSASLDVRRAYRAWRSSVAKVDTARRQVALAFEALQLAQAAYEAGSSTNLEVVDAQRSHRDAEANLVVATYDSQVALANLLLSTGQRFH